MTLRFRGVLAIGTAGFMAIVGLTAYVARGPIVAGFARRWLSGYGVASAVEVRGLSLTGFQGSLRLGAPADPELTAERLEVDYRLVGPWNGKALGLDARAVRLFHPRLKLHMVDGKLDLGVLARLVHEIQTRQTAGGAGPDVSIQDGQVLLATAGGDLRLTGGGEMRGGRLASFGGRLEPFSLALGQDRWASVGGPIQGVRVLDRLVASIDLGATSVRTNAGSLGMARGLLSANIPYPSAVQASGARGWSGTTTLGLTLSEVAGDMGGTRIRGGGLNASFTGALEAGDDPQSLTGVLEATGRIGAVASGGVGGRLGLARLHMTRLAFSRAASRLSITGDGAAAISLAGADAADGRLTALSSLATIHDLDFSVSNGRPTLAAVLDGSLAGKGAVAAERARNLAQTVPLISGEAVYAAALERGLRAFRFAAPAWRATLSPGGIQVSLKSPLRIDAGSGAHLSLGGALKARGEAASGSADIALAGGSLPSLSLQSRRWIASPSGGQADLTARGAFDLFMAREVNVELAGRALWARHGLLFDLARCAPATARLIALKTNMISDFTAEVCPGEGPLIEGGAGGWRARGRLRNAAAAMAAFSVAARDADGAFDATGDAKGLEGAAVTLDRGTLLDTNTADAIRFGPVKGAGRFDFAAGAWRGEVFVASQAGHPIGRIRLLHEVATGAGRVDIDAGDLHFARSGLTPAELTPLAASVREADGLAGFTGWVAWSPAGALTSGGEFKARTLAFKGPAGPMRNIDADIRFISLAPLVTAPDQEITIGEIQSVIPVTGLAVVFDLDADRLSLRAASAVVAKGRVSLEPMTVPFHGAEKLTGDLTLDHVDLGDIIATTNIGDLVKTDAVIDGRIPFEVVSSHLTITGGRLAAVAPGHLTISRKPFTGAAPSPSTGQGAFAQDIAYQAMEDLAFDQLDVAVNSQAGDRLGMLFHIRGRHDPPQRQRAVIAVADLIAGRALAKPMTLPSDTGIDLTLDSSLNFGELIQALGAAWRDALARGEGDRHSGRVQGSNSISTTAQGPKPP